MLKGKPIGLFNGVGFFGYHSQKKELCPNKEKWLTIKAKH